MQFIFKSILCTGLASFAAFAATQSDATSFSFTAEVTATSVVGDAVFPTLGDIGTITVEIADSDPNASLYFLGDPNDPNAMITLPIIGPIAVEAEVAGIFSSSLPFGATYDPNDIMIPQVATSTTGFTYGSSYEYNFLTNPGTQTFLPKGLNSFGFTFGTAQANAPLSVGDLAAALALPGGTGLYIAEFEDPNSASFHRVELSIRPSSVPVPASVPLMLTGIAGFVWAKRQRRQ